MKWVKRLLVAVAVLFVGFLLLAGIGALFVSDHLSDKPFVGQIVIEKGIYDAKSILDQVAKLRKEEQLAAVLIRIDSPGGAIGASQEIFFALQEFKEDSIPVVVSMGNVAASGGLYCSLAGDKVFALPGTITGSIGVISQFPEATDLLDKVGVKFHTVKTGLYKDAGSPFRPANSADIESFDRLLQEMFAQFIDDIAAAKGLPRDSVLALADGSVFSGRQGVGLGLVDTLGTWHDALKWVVKKAALPEDAPVRSALPPKGLMEKIWEGPTAQLREMGLSWSGGPAWLWPGH